MSNIPSEDVTPNRLEGGLKVDLSTNAHDTFLKIRFIRVMSYLIVHCVQPKYKQGYTYFMFTIQPKQKEVFCWESGRGALLQMEWN